MKSIGKPTIIFLSLFVTCTLFAASEARPAGAINSWYTALIPSATGKPGTGEYTLRDMVNDNRKNNLAFVHEVCPPLARIVDQLCQAVENLVERMINFAIGGRMAPRGETTTEGSPSTETTSEGGAEETTPSSGESNGSSGTPGPKTGAPDSSEGSSSSESSSEASSSESSSESSTDKPADTETATSKP